jgi:hypothetical protein
MIVVETKLAVLLEVSRTRSGASQVLQSQFFDVLQGFSLTPDVLVQLQSLLPLTLSFRRTGRKKKANLNFRICGCPACHCSNTTT